MSNEAVEVGVSGTETGSFSSSTKLWKILEPRSLKHESHAACEGIAKQLYQSEEGF